MINGDKVF